MGRWGVWHWFAVGSGKHCLISSCIRWNWPLRFLHKLTATVLQLALQQMMATTPTGTPQLIRLVSGGAQGQVWSKRSPWQTTSPSTQALTQHCWWCQNILSFTHWTVLCGAAAKCWKCSSEHGLYAPVAQSPMEEVDVKQKTGTLKPTLPLCWALRESERPCWTVWEGQRWDLAPEPGLRERQELEGGQHVRRSCARDDTGPVQLDDSEPGLRGTDGAGWWHGEAGLGAGAREKPVGGLKSKRKVQSLRISLSTEQRTGWMQGQDWKWRVFPVLQWLRIHCQWDMGSVPGLGRFHMPQGNENPRITTAKPVLWSPGATSTEPERREPTLHNKAMHGNSADRN